MKRAIFSIGIFFVGCSGAPDTPLDNPANKNVPDVNRRELGLLLALAVHVLPWQTTTAAGVAIAGTILRAPVLRDRVLLARVLLAP